MEQDTLKSMWKDMNNTPKDREALRSMMLERKHPELKHIRRQLIIETVAFTAFLFVYYDFFDGDRKPFYANVLLLGAMLLVIVHNVAGYILTKRRIKDGNIKQSLENHLFKMKVYAVVSVASRVLAAGCLLLFFTSAITFNMGKYWLLAGVIAVFIVQISLLSRIWLTRIRQMKDTVNGFSISH